MNNTKIAKTILLILSVLILALVLSLPQSSGIVPLPTQIANRVTLGSGAVYDCNGGVVAGITIKNATNVTVRNCVIAPTSGTGIQVTDSSFVSIASIRIVSNIAEGSGIDLASTSDGLTHDVAIQDCQISGNMGWGISGSEKVLKNITVQRCLIEDIGKSGGSQKHGMYVNNWQNFLIEDVTINRPYNMGIKVVGNVTDGVFNRVTIQGAGRSGVSGHGIGLGEGVRSSDFQRLKILDCNIQNSKDSGIDGEYAKNSTMTIDGCFLKNNYYGIQVGATGNAWTVTNNTAYNQTSCSACRWPLILLGTESGSVFDYNNWYKDGQSPIRVGSAILMFTQWQARGNDAHGVSQLPEAIGTPTLTQPSITPSDTHSASPTPVFTPTMTPVPTFTKTSTPTWTHTPTHTTTMTLTHTATPTLSLTLTSTMTHTATATQTPTFTPTMTETATPTETMIIVRCDQYYLPEICIFRMP
jgi:hypothetical protein